MKRHVLNDKWSSFKVMTIGKLRALAQKLLGASNSDHPLLVELQALAWHRDDVEVYVNKKTYETYCVCGCDRSYPS
jgi:hypothetical protein